MYKVNVDTMTIKYSKFFGPISSGAIYTITNSCSSATVEIVSYTRRMNNGACGVAGGVTEAGRLVDRCIVSNDGSRAGRKCGYDRERCCAAGWRGRCRRMRRAGCTPAPTGLPATGRTAAASASCSSLLGSSPAGSARRIWRSTPTTSPPPIVPAARWDPRGWSVDQAARLLLLLARAKRPGFAPVLDQLFVTADVGELVAFYRGLPLYPDPAAHLARAEEGARSNMKAVFEAVAHRNPYPCRAFLRSGVEPARAEGAVRR